MTASTKTLAAASLLTGLFETVSTVTNGREDGAGAALFTAAFAAVFLVGGALLARNGSRAAAHVVGVLLLLDVAGLPFYERSGVADWVVQGLFGAVGIVGVAAWVGVLRERRAAKLAHA